MEATLYAVNVLRVAHAIVVVLQSLSLFFDKYTPDQVKGVANLMESQIKTKVVPMDSKMNFDIQSANKTVNTQGQEETKVNLAYDKNSLQHPKSELQL
jgi:hypothetical protein